MMRWARARRNARPRRGGGEAIVVPHEQAPFLCGTAIRAARTAREIIGERAGGVNN